MTPRLRAQLPGRLGRILPLLLTSIGLLGGACIIEERAFNEQLARCDDYCNLLGQKCPGPLSVYDESSESPRGVCLSTCQLMPSGEGPGGATGNTLRCRLDRLSGSDFEADSECPGMGPGGNGVCGTDCEAYCALRRAACGELQPNEPEIANPDSCIERCEALADDSGFAVRANLGEDTLQCRMIHLSEATLGGEVAETHCWHTQLVVREQDNPPCSGPADLDQDTACERYCRLVMVACQGEFQVYDDAEQCERACALMDLGSPTDTSSNTIGCRRYHAYSALTNPTEHCTHAGPTGDGHCGLDAETNTGSCASHCTMLKQGCNALFTERYGGVATDPSDLGTCKTECATLDDAQIDGFRDLPPRYSVGASLPAGSLRCRTLHAVRALDAPGDAAECAAAFGDPGSPCQ